MSWPFIRKNTLTVTAAFTAADGSTTQPTTATAVVNYRARINKRRTTATIALSYVSPTTVTKTRKDGSTYTVTEGNNWTGDWDTSPAEPGVVEWLVYGDGALQAASQGRFELLANLANQATS